LIWKRVTAGVLAARANGKTLGRPKRVFRRDEAMRLDVVAEDCAGAGTAGNNGGGGVPVAALSGKQTSDPCRRQMRASDVSLQGDDRCSCFRMARAPGLYLPGQKAC